MRSQTLRASPPESGLHDTDRMGFVDHRMMNRLQLLRMCIFALSWGLLTFVHCAPGHVHRIKGSKAGVGAEWDLKPEPTVLSFPDGLNGHRLTVDILSGSVILATHKKLFSSPILKSSYLQVRYNSEKNVVVFLSNWDSGILVEVPTWKIRARFKARLASYHTELGLVTVNGFENDPQRFRVGDSERVLSSAEGTPIAISPDGRLLLAEFTNTTPRSKYRVYAIRAGTRLQRLFDFVAPYRDGASSSIVQVSPNRYAVELSDSFTSVAIYVVDVRGSKASAHCVASRGALDHEDHIQQSRSGVVAVIFGVGGLPQRSSVLLITATNVRDLGYFDPKYGFMIKPNGELFPYVPKSHWPEPMPFSWLSPASGSGLSFFGAG